jgi:hypothetical protein
MSMKVKKTTRICTLVFPVLWVIVLSAIGISLALNGKVEATFSQEENRMLQGLPALTLDSMLKGEFSGQFENYLLDNFPLRNQFVSVSKDIQNLASIASMEDMVLAAGDQADELTEDVTLLPAPPSVDAGEETETPEAVLEGNSSIPAGSLEFTATPLLTPTESLPTIPTPIAVVTPKPTYPSTVGIYYTSSGGKKVSVRTYKASNVEYAAGVLNEYAQCLGDGGRLCFIMVPSSTAMNKYIVSKQTSSLSSNVEDCLRANVDPNVEIFSIPEVLSEPIQRKEYVYLHTDMHWTPLGAHYVYEAMMRKLGMEPVAYSNLTIQQEKPFLGTIYRDNPTAAMRRNPDTLDVYQPFGETELRKVTAPGKYEVIPMINTKAASNDRFTVFMCKPGYPWCYIKTNAGTGRKALVVMDSFGLCFTPLLVPHYDEIHIMDPRFFNKKIAGGSVKELIGQYGIDDCFVVIGDLHAYNNSFLQSMMRKALNK